MKKEVKKFKTIFDVAYEQGTRFLMERERRKNG